MEASKSAQVTVWTTRTVKPGCEDAFEKAMHEFAERSLPLPGQLGVHIIRPAPGSGSRRYRMIRKFADRAALAAFRESAEYAEWNRLVRDLTEGEPRLEELSGLESWFTPETAPLRPLPRWKMAIATFLGVYPVAMALNLTLGPVIRTWPFLLGNAVFNACVVALLTWVVMPLVTRVLHRWLHPGDAGS